MIDKMKNKKPTVILENAREKEQLEVMKKILDKGICPFCEDNLGKFHHKPILKRGKFWTLTINQWPYKNTKIHLLAISKTHAEKLSDLKSIAGKELWELMSWAEKKYKIKGGALCFRFGDPQLNKATVNHLHAHLLTVKIKKPESRGYETIKFKVG